MSRPSIQKYLGWFQRFLYQVELGPQPVPVPVVDVSLDWPLVPRPIDVAYNSIAGTLQTVLYAPPDGFHGLVVFASVVNALAAGDTVGIVWDRNPTATPTFFLNRYVNTAAIATYNPTPLIGSAFGSDVAGGSLSQLRGIDPVYVPSGFRLVLYHSSAAGGVAFQLVGLVYERPSYYPLRLP